MIFFDALRSTFKTVKIRSKRADCIVCSENATLKDVKEFNYEEFVGTPRCDITAKLQLPLENEISALDFHHILQSPEKDTIAVVDVRDPGQFNIVHLPQAINLPQKGIEKDISEISELI